MRDAAGAQQALYLRSPAADATSAPLPPAQAACEGALSTHAPEGITFKCAALGTPDTCAAAISMGAQDFSVFGGEWVVGWWGLGIERALSQLGSEGGQHRWQA